MKTSWQTSIFLVFVLVLLASGRARAQTPTSENEVWPRVVASLELLPRTRLQVFTQLENGEDFPYLQWKVGALVNYRMRPILHQGEPDIDEENEHHLVVGVGYVYLQTIQNDKTKRENRIDVQAVGRHRTGGGFLLTDRNLIEFRWNNGVYDFRYRNKLTLNRAFRVNKFRFTPYGSGEPFWDRNHHSWNENQVALGVELPYKKRLMLDTYYLHQNCTTCSQQHINVFGLALNLYFKRKK